MLHTAYIVAGNEYHKSTGGGTRSPHHSQADQVLNSEEVHAGPQCKAPEKEMQMSLKNAQQKS